MSPSDLVRLYPRAWRARYGEEFIALLETAPRTRRDRLDILRGALDAHLHPARPSLVPGLSALLGGGLWMLGSAPIAALPTPPDWPGYLLESLPLAIVAAAALAIAVAGAWLREDGRGGTLGRRLGRAGVVLGLGGHLAWAGALIGVLTGLVYGPPVAIASTVAGLGTVLVGLALLAAGDGLLGGLLVLAPVLLVLPPWMVPSPGAWLAFGAVWIGAGLIELFGRPRVVGPLRWT